MLLDDVMPHYDLHEVHATTIAAPPERVYQAIYDVRAAVRQAIAQTPRRDANIAGADAGQRIRASGRGAGT